MVLRSLVQWDWAPEALGPFETIRARVMWRSLVVLLAVLVLAIVVQTVLRPEMVWVPLGFLLPPVAGCVLLRRGWQQAAAMLQLMSWVLSLTVLWGPTGGVHGTIAVFVPLGVVWSVVFLDRPYAIVLVAVQCAVLLLDAPLIAIWHGVSVVDPAGHGTALAISYAIAVVVATALAGTLLDALTRTEVEADARAADARVAQARAVDASGAKSRFLATMSHELRTPLNAILGYADLLEEDACPDEWADLARIGASGAHLRDLIDDVLEVARAEATSADPERAADLRAVLDETHTRWALRATGIDGPGCVVRIRHDVLARTLANLARQLGPLARAEVRVREEDVEIEVLGGSPEVGEGLHVWIAQRMAASQGARVELLGDRYRISIPRAT